VISTVDFAEFGESALRENLEDLGWVERTARRHDEVVRRAAAITTALVPFRLVTIYRSDAAARDRIEELYDDLSAALDRVDGRSEWSVKIYSRGLGTGIAYLERRRAEIRERQAAEADQQALADQLFWELVPAAAATRRLAPQDQRLSGRRQPMVLNATFLVDDDRSTEFFELIDGLRARYSTFDIEVDGPWPPYSFAVLDKP
jgi:hypothetical protein